MKRHRRQTSGSTGETVVAKSFGKSPAGQVQDWIWMSTLGLLLFAVFMGVAQSAELPAAPSGRGLFQAGFRHGGQDLRIEINEARAGASASLLGVDGQTVAQCQVLSVEAQPDGKSVRVVDFQCSGAGFSELSTRAALYRESEPRLEFGTFLTGYRRVPVHVLFDQLAPIGGPKQRALASR